MSKANYIPRVIDDEVELYLSAFGAVCIEGPKWCGKTWTSSHHANSEIFLGDPTGGFENKTLAELSADLVLNGKTPRLIDEWQEVPAIWDAVRHKVDTTGNKGQFILTGSSTPTRKGIMHSGAGRIARIKMRPMSLFEMGASSGKVSLEDVCAGKEISANTGAVQLSDLVDAILRGGWPANVNATAKQARLLPGQYIDAIVDSDASRLDNILRNKDKMMKLLKSLARNETTMATNTTLARDIKESDNDTIDKDTVAEYLDVFNRLFMLDDQPPFSTNIRSSVRVKQAAKRHFCDPSIACALLGATHDSLMHDLNTLGFMFEALCERDLKIYTQSFGASLYHYRAYDNREIDAVIELEDGRWCAFEVKLGANQVDEAAKNLLELDAKIRADEHGKPAAVMGVICGLARAAYVRPDGVYVLPITALKN